MEAKIKSNWTKEEGGVCQVNAWFCIIRYVSLWLDQAAETNIWTPYIVNDGLVGEKQDIGEKIYLINFQPPSCQLVDGMLEVRIDTV